MRPTGLLQPLSIPALKWEDISIDFIVGLPLTSHKFKSIWVIVDRPTKSTHFILVHTFYRTEKYAELYISRILCLHGVPKTIISDQGPQFISHLWEKLHASLGTHLIHSSDYHPQTNDQTERVNQILEDIFGACALNYPDKWDKCLPLAEFSCNNSYQESLKMVPFEALYGRRCHTPINWIEPGERMIFDPDLVIEIEEIVYRIQSNLNAAKA
jgi:transposase InsO family protein